MPRQKVDVIATRHAGHAEQLAYELAVASRRPLVISSSGDGGYHEVVNGIMRASAEGSQPTAGLLPAGNANDHHAMLHEKSIVDRIITDDATEIDLLQISATVHGKPFQRYAHSYIGIGLTPEAGRDLTKAKLNRFNEIIIVLRVLFFLKPIAIEVAGRIRFYDSLVFSNAEKMSKVLTLSKSASIRDGKFEVTAFRRRNKLQLILSLLKASTRGLAGDKHVTSYTFKTIKPTLIQLDGEVMTLDAETAVTIIISQRVLRCIV